MELMYPFYEIAFVGIKNYFQALVIRPKYNQV